MSNITEFKTTKYSQEEESMNSIMGTLKVKKSLTADDMYMIFDALQKLGIIECDPSYYSLAYFKLIEHYNGLGWEDEHLFEFLFHAAIDPRVLVEIGSKYLNSLTDNAPHFDEEEF